jgi:hypothetical protein
VRFRITRHSARKPPSDALELLWPLLGSKRDDVSFAKVGTEIRATWGADAPVSMERDERIEMGRRTILNILHDVCDRAPELRFDWYAVSE